jgi:hypothetical protein
MCHGVYCETTAAKAGAASPALRIYRLPKTFSWTTVWAGDPRPQLVLLYRSVDVLSMLPDVKSQDLVGQIHAEFEKHKKPKHLADDPDAVARLNRSLNDAFALLSSKLQRVWSKGYRIP